MTGPGRADRAAGDGPTVNCPSCGQPTRFAPTNPWRPFCSESCRTVDLGAWASERYRMPANPPADDDDLPPSATA